MQLAAVLRDLAICCQGVKSETKSSSNSEITGSLKIIGIVQEYNANIVSTINLDIPGHNIKAEVGNNVQASSHGPSAGFINGKPFVSLGK